MHLDKNIKLLDSPGIVFAAAENDAAAVLRNCVKIEKLVDPGTGARHCVTWCDVLLFWLWQVCLQGICCPVVWIVIYV